MNNIASRLIALYGAAIGRATFDRVAPLLDRYRTRIQPPRAHGLTERDAILITYGDQVREPNIPPLRTLADFCERHLTGLCSGIHLLPFYPYSSDDGFAVIDYRTIDPMLGDWEDVARLGWNFRLMFDAVVNHVSAQSQWFQRFLRGDPEYRDYFIGVPEGTDLSSVVRPRTFPLLTRFNTPGGQQNVWTTFGADQIDLNYRNPDVLLEIIDTLLFYVTRGAECIRLDAIAYLWKEIGTPCIHLPQTHLVVQILRAVLEEIAPHVLLITETNVPHRENISYFGDGGNEAQMVYNFALPPLTLHAFHTANAETLSRWANTLTLPSKRVTFFNFLASHDGIGITPARDLLTRAEIDALVEHVQHHGGLVSARTNSDGTTSVYELNINYFDALSNPHAHEPLDTQIDRFMTAQAIMLSLVGVPGIYFHSLFGSRGWREGVKATGHNRAINREKCDLQTLERELADRNSRRCQVFARYKQLLQARAAHRAFDPFGEMRVLDVGRSVFAVWRVSARGDQRVLCLHNVSERAQSVALGGSVDSLSGQLTDLITGQMVDVEHLRLVPYQVLWLSF